MSGVQQWESMKIFAPTLVAVTLFMQPSRVAPRDLLRSSRALTNAEIAVVLGASQRAIAGKTFRLASIRGGQGPDILMGRNGSPRRVRWAGSIIGGTVGGVVSGSGESSRSATTTWQRVTISITDYTGRTARDCTSAVEAGELVVEYEFDNANPVWKAKTRWRHRRDFGPIGIAPVFEMLQGVGIITSGELNQIGRHSARALVSTWTPPARPSPEPPVVTGDPIPNVRGEPVPIPDEGTQNLWIDTRTLLPVRWDVSEHGSRFGFDFNYSSADVRLPKGVRPRDCVR